MRKHLFTAVIIAGFLLSCASRVSAQVSLSARYDQDNAPTIGTFHNSIFKEGGFSGLHYIPNTSGKEFWAVTDRGVNIDAENANAQAGTSIDYMDGCKPTYDKIYAFPKYAPKILRLKIEGNAITVLQSITIKRPDGTDATGLLNPAGLGSTELKVASTDIVSDCANFDANTVSKDTWGIDSEGIDMDKYGNFWICEEGGPTIWKVSPTGVVLKRYTPYSQNQQPQDVAIDPCFSFRRNNRGFEGITITPNGKVYAILQSPLYYKNVSGVARSGKVSNSQIHRILEIDPVTDTTKMYAYENEGAMGSIKPKDWKIGDLTAVNDTQFLVLEQGAEDTDIFKTIYTIDISNATPVKSGLAYNGKTLEELNTPEALNQNGITAVTKTEFFKLSGNGWPKRLDKAEGIAIIDSKTIAVCNDNDYGYVSEHKDGIAKPTGVKSSIYIFTLAEADALRNYVPNLNSIPNNVPSQSQNKTKSKKASSKSKSKVKK